MRLDPSPLLIRQHLQTRHPPIKQAQPAWNSKTRPSPDYEAGIGLAATSARPATCMGRLVASTATAVPSSAPR